MKKKIKKILENIISQFWKDFDLEKIIVSYPKENKFGDFSTNIAMSLAGVAEKNPMKIAEKIKKVLEEKINEIDEVEKIEIIQPGYINFYLSKKYFAKSIQKVLEEKSKWGRNNSLVGKLFLAEHTDPNLFKEFHIGHLMTNTIGESLGRIAEFSGANVKQVTFQGDVGLHVAKTLWGIKDLKDEMPNADDYIWIKQAFLGKCYAWGEKNYSEEGNDKIKKEIIAINKLIYSKGDNKQNKIYNIGKEWSMEYFEEIYKILGSKFDHYFLESETFEDGEKIVNENIGEVFEKSKGAIIFPGSKYDLHDRVFINSENLPTYETKDIGLFYNKWKKYNPDISLTITGGEQKEYFQVVKKVAGMINKEWDEKTVHIAHGILKLKNGKMSSRKGEIIRSKNWIEDTTIVILKKMNDDEKSNSFDTVKKSDVQKIAISAIKYSILKVMAGKNIIYDKKKSISFEGNTGPYLQYSFVRASSILRKVEKVEKVEEVEDVEVVPAVGKTILKFPEVVEESLKNYSSHTIANFLHQLASEFNSFYAQTKILDNKENPDYKYNLALTKAVKITLKNGLYLLGIKTVERM